MSEWKFTKGPWKVCHHLQSLDHDASCGCGYNGGIWGNGGETLVCEMGNCPRCKGSEMIPIADRPTQLADAHLIAAAPDLYEQLQKAIMLCRSQGYSMHEAEDALAKARGESPTPNGKENTHG